MRRNHLPTIGLVIAVCLFVTAGRLYSGGTLVSANTAGYNWARNYISSLFAPRALNGAPNPSRYIAMLAMAFLCASIAVMFARIAAAVTPPFHRKTIQIAGIGSGVYGFMISTPMHNLMVDIGLLFGFTAQIATTHVLYVERRWLLFGWGVLSIALAVLTAAMYYANMLYGSLPVVQKVSLVSSIGWVLAVYYSFNRRPKAGMMLSESVAPAP